jgi:antitoxin VapB
MTRSTKKHRSQPGKVGPRPAVAEAKVFMTGRSQAVRLPKEYRVTGNSVFVKRFGNSIVLIPKTADRWAGLFAALDEFPRDLCWSAARTRRDMPTSTNSSIRPRNKRRVPARYHGVDRSAAHQFPLDPPKAFRAQQERHRSFDHHGVRARVWPRASGSPASAPAREGTTSALCHRLKAAGDCPL